MAGLGIGLGLGFITRAPAGGGEELGPELIQNGDMGSDVGWTLNDQGGLAVIEISGGKLNVDDSANEVGGTSAAQVPTLDVATYRLSYDIESISGSGGEEVSFGVGGTIATTRTAPGSYQEDVNSAGADNFSITFGAGTVCVIDNVSLKKVL